MKSGQPLGLSIFAKVRELPLSEQQGEVCSDSLVVQNTYKSTIFYSTTDFLNDTRTRLLVASEDDLDTLSDQLSKEDTKIRFEYRQQKTFEFGHGISVGWLPTAGEVTSIYSEYIHTVELTPMSFDLEGLSKDILRPDSYLFEVL